MAKVKRNCKRATTRWYDTFSGNPLVRSSQNWEKRIQTQITIFGLAMKNDRSQTVHFAICLNNEGYQASLEKGKLYRIVPDAEAKAHGLIRVIDESGEDYAFAANRFYPIELPENVEELLLATSC